MKKETRRSSSDKVADEMAALFHFNDESGSDEKNVDKSRDFAIKISTKSSISNIDDLKSKKVRTDVHVEASKSTDEHLRAQPFRVEQGREKGAHGRASVGDLLVLDFFVKNEEQCGLNIYQYSEVGQAIDKSAPGVRKNVQRLVGLGFLARLTGLNCGSGHGFVVKVTDSGLAEWQEKHIIAWAVLKSKKVRTAVQGGAIDKNRLEKDLFLSNHADSEFWDLDWNSVPSVVETEVHKLVESVHKENQNRPTGRKITAEAVGQSLMIFQERCQDFKYLESLKSPMAVFKKEVLDSWSGVIRSSGKAAVKLAKKERVLNYIRGMSNEDKAAAITKMRSFDGWELVDNQVCIEKWVESFGLKGIKET